MGAAELTDHGSPELAGAPARLGIHADVEPNADVLEAPIEGELVLLDPGAGTYFGLNETGTAIWGLLRAGRSIAETANHMSARFDVDPERARADVDRLVARLEAAGLVRRLPRGAGDGGAA
jgi:hypothetical protein